MMKFETSDEEKKQIAFDDVEVDQDRDLELRMKALACNMRSITTTMMTTTTTTTTTTTLLLLLLCLLCRKKKVEWRKAVTDESVSV